MKKWVKVLALVSCIAGGNANAVVAKWTGYKTVTSVQVVDSGGIIIFLDSEINPKCTKSGTEAVYVHPSYHNMTDKGVDGVRSTAFLALSTGMKVNVLYDESTAFCYGRDIIITK